MAAAVVVQVSGPTVQEYDAPNVVMRDYLCCAVALPNEKRPLLHSFWLVRWAD